MDEHWRFHGHDEYREPTHVTTDLAGERHRIVDWTDDPRVAIVACGRKVALIGNGHPDPAPCPRETHA